MAKRTLDRMYREWLEEQPDSPALAESPSRSKQPSCRARFPTLPKTPPRSPSPCLPHYPSDAAIHPDQAPLREALRIDSHGRKNIKLLERLGEKSTQPALLGNKDSMASKPSISSNDVVGLLAAQGQRRRKQIYDERKGLSVPAEFEDRANRRRSMDIALGEPEPGTPPDDSTASQLPWTPTDEKKVTLFSLEENPNYKCNPVAFSKVEVLDALEQGYTGDNVLAFLNARTDLELEMMRSSRSSKHSFHTAEETDSVHAYAYNRNEPKSLYFHPNTALTPPSSTVDQATVRVESHGSESMSSAHLPFAGHAASSVSPSDKNSSSPPLRSSRKFGKDINLRSHFSATTASEAATTPDLDRTKLSAAESHRTSNISSESSEPSAATLTPEASAAHEAAVAHALSALGSRGVIKTVTVEKRVVFVEQSVSQSTEPSTVTAIKATRSTKGKERAVANTSNIRHSNSPVKHDKLSPLHGYPKLKQDQPSLSPSPVKRSLAPQPLHFASSQGPTRTRPLPPPIKIFPAHAVLDLDALSTPDSAPPGSPNKFDGKPTTFNMDMKPFNLDRSVASLYTFNLYLRNRETNRNNRTSPAGEINDRDESGRDRAGPSTTQTGPAEETNETTAENAETTEEPAGIFGANGVTTDGAESSANTNTAAPQAAMVQPSQAPTMPTTNVANNPSANMGVATTAAAPALHLGLAPNNPPADNGSDESDEDSFTLKGLARTLNKLFPEGLTVGMANAMPAVMEAFEGNLDDNNAANANAGNAALTKEERYLKYLCEFIEALSVGKVQAEQRENVTIQQLRIAIEREARLRAEGEGLRRSLGYWEQSYNAVFAGAGNGNGPTAPQHGESSSAGAAREAALAATQHAAPQPTTTTAPATEPPGNMWPMMLALDRLRRDNMRLYDIVGQLTTRCRALEQRHALDHPSDADFFASTENWNNTTMATGGFDANTQTQPPFAPVPIDGMDGTNIPVILAMNNPDIMQAAGRAFFREFNYHAGQITHAMMAANLAQQPAPPLPVPGPQPPAPGAAPPSAPIAPTNPAPFPGTQGPAGLSDPAGAL